VDPPLNRFRSIGHKSLLLTIFCNIICTQRIINKWNVTFSKRKFWHVICIPLSSLLGFMNKIFKALSCLFVENKTAPTTQHDLRILQSATIEKVNQLLLSNMILHFHFHRKMDSLMTSLLTLGPSTTFTT